MTHEQIAAALTRGNLDFTIGFRLRMRRYEIDLHLATIDHDEGDVT